MNTDTNKPFAETLAVHLQRLEGLYAERDYAGLPLRVLEVLHHLTVTPLARVNAQARSQLVTVYRLLSRILGDPSFRIPDNRALSYISCNSTIANLARLASPAGNTDALLRKVLKQESNFYKVLTLYSIHNDVDVSLETLFKGHAFLASYWWSEVIVKARTRCVTDKQQHRLAHFLDEKILETHLVLPVIRYQGGKIFANQNIFSIFSYGDPDKASVFRDHLADLIRQQPLYPSLKQPTQHDFDTLVVISANFHKGTETYRALAPMLSGLKRRYRLIYAALRKSPDVMERHDDVLFDELFFLTDAETPVLPSQERLQALVDKGAGTVMFPDIGTEMTSVVLANLRIAPLQVSGYGNVLSSHSPYVDYVLGGSLVETAETCKRYAEEVALLPGAALVPTPLAYTPAPHAARVETASVRVACVWGNVKFNATHLRRLKEIHDRAKKPVHYVFFGMEDRYLACPSIAEDLQSYLPGGSVSLTPTLSPEAYVDDLANCDLALDAHPFGNYIAIVDALSCGLPFLALEGTQTRNRLGRALLLQLGLEELIARDEQDWIRRAVTLVDDAPYRRALASRLHGIETTFKEITRHESNAFAEKVDALVQKTREADGRGAKPEHP